MARANTEQAISGQMGQPAACMMENKWSLRADEMHRDYGAGVANSLTPESVGHFVRALSLRYIGVAPVCKLDGLKTIVEINSQ
jgi:hypothetical protein